MEESERTKSLSITINLDDLDYVDSDSSTDSDRNNLQIDVSEVDHFDDTNKLRKQEVEDTSFLNEMEEEIERQLDAKAAKTKLTATNVKNILKHVISNETVMAMVHKKLTNDDIVFEPKLTRAKAKELAMAQPDIPWAITPVKSNISQSQILIEEELSEDSSDEEYKPDQDQQSDDEKDIDSSVGNDIDSLPSTPADASVGQEMQETPEIQYDEQGVFKVPQSIAPMVTEDESIGHRTRSKLCLTETPLELLEQMLDPPDVTPDMYDWGWADDEYSTFLAECYAQPIQNVENIEDDPEADPEYNILEDEDADFLDEEEFREDRAVKVPKKELNDIISEQHEFTDQYKERQEPIQQPQSQQVLQVQFQSPQQLQQQQHPKSTTKKKNKTPNNSITTLGSISPANPMIELLPVLAEPELPQIINEQQRYLISVQMSQHVQLLAQQFVMAYKHPHWDKLSQICKENLYSLSYLGNKEDSAFIAQNLADALKLVRDWEDKLKEPEFSEEYINCLKTLMVTEMDYFKQKRTFTVQFHPELFKLMAHSKALMHPKLLPDKYPSYLTKKQFLPYLPSEENLVAIGLEQFIPYVKSMPKKFSRSRDILADSVALCKKYLLPIRDVTGLIHLITKRKFDKKKLINPIRYYFSTGRVPKIEHLVLNKYKTLAPIQQRSEFLSRVWREYIKNLATYDVEEYLKCTKLVSTNKEVNYDLDLPVSIDEILIHQTHELRNPIVNMMSMPTLMTPMKDDSTSPPKDSSSRNSSTTKVRSLSVKTNETESDAESAESQRTCETDEEESKPAATTATRLRMTTPRLAKIKSAQNMKLLAQSLSPKGSSSASSVNVNADIKEDMNNDDKNDDDTSSFTKGDNEDEIAELMLASTTIKKNTTSRKKTKQARELENLKRLVEAENNINEDERATRFAASFIQKVHVKLESKDPELFKTVLKIFLDHSEKADSANQANSYFENDAESSLGVKGERKECDKDTLAINLYREVCEKLYEYPDLCSDFLLFLTPQQASMVEKSVEHTMMLNMKDFVNVTQMYFVKQPSRVAKVMQAITQMASDPYITIEEAQNVMGTALKGHPLIMDMFLKVLPTGKPPDSLLAAHMFENLSCPVGPHDKNKTYDADAPELYENIELPVSTPQEDPYGGESCKCDCHSLADDLKSKGMNEHCASCGTRFLNGRIYLQTSEGLRPAKITFPGADDEKLENISRVSLKTTEKLITSQPTRKRRKYSKRESISEETNVKPSTSKGSPTKDSEDADKSKSNKKGLKSPLKATDSKKLPKIQPSTSKGKREKKVDKKDCKNEQKTDDDQNEYNANTDQTDVEEGTGSNVNEEYGDMFGNKFSELSTDSHEDDTMTSPEKLNTSSTSTKKLELSSDSDSSTNIDIKSIADMAWTMQEDKVLLEHVQNDYSEKTFHTVSLLLKNRTVEQVKERCEYLLALIEQMT